MCKRCKEIKKNNPDYIYCPICGTPYENENDLFKMPKKGNFYEIITQYTADQEVIDSFNHFIDMRKLKKKAPTAHAVILILDKIYKKWGYSDLEAILVFNNSVSNSWTDVYPLKKEEKEKEKKSYEEENKTNYNDVYNIYRWEKWKKKFL